MWTLPASSPSPNKTPAGTLNWDSKDLFPDFIPGVAMPRSLVQSNRRARGLCPCWTGCKMALSHQQAPFCFAISMNLGVVL